LQSANLSSLQKVGLQNRRPPPDEVPQKVWTDSLLHLSKDQEWPAHAVPLFVFSGQDRPRPAYREQIKIVLTDDMYKTFILKFRCGIGDRYDGGSIGLVHSPNRREAHPGFDGQLVMVTNIMVNPDTSVTITCIGDLDFRVINAWMPRGLMGLQLGTVEVVRIDLELEPILETCRVTQGVSLFGRLVSRLPGLAELLSSPNQFTVFAPTDEALISLVVGADDPEEALLSHPALEGVLRCHVCQGRVARAGLYNDRNFRSIDGTMLNVTFGVWPRAEPAVNGVPIVKMDVPCKNGVVHNIDGVLQPKPQAFARTYR
jgi:hypothetical protein